ncbi:MAG: MBL fold metallo-hydrolase [Sideroxyarcus sp.]|nr:MBL fold metallo-hydrolase [Sideroxyarcus sp.]
MKLIVHGFFDPATWTVSYVAYEKEGSACAIIDSVLDYDPKSGRTCTISADKLIAFVREKNLQVAWILETHAHADHLSAAPYLRKQLGGKIAIGVAITGVQKVFKDIFNLEPEFQADGSQFDNLLKDGEPCHRRLDDADDVGAGPYARLHGLSSGGCCVFVGDTLFMPDVGTARCDFPGGDAHQLYASMRKLLSLPDETRLFMCHDCPARWPRASLGNHGRGSTHGQHSRARRCKRSRLREDTHGAGRHVGDASADSAIDSSQYSCGRNATQRSLRSVVNNEYERDYAVSFFS